jgi:hypothetical protein
MMRLHFDDASFYEIVNCCQFSKRHKLPDQKYYPAGRSSSSVVAPDRFSTRFSSPRQHGRDLSVVSVPSEAETGNLNGNLTTIEQVWGKGSLDCTNSVSATYHRIAKSIAAYERSKEANPFSSRYDYWIGKKVKFSDEEMEGLKLFEGKGKCAECHPKQTRS